MNTGMMRSGGYRKTLLKLLFLSRASKGLSIFVYLGSKFSTSVSVLSKGKEDGCSKLCVGFHVIRQLQQQQYNSTSDMASARRFVPFVMLDPLTSASKVPANSYQVLDFLIGFRYPIANFPVDLLLPRPEYMPLPNLGLPEPNVSPSSN